MTQTVAMNQIPASVNEAFTQYFIDCGNVVTNVDAFVNAYNNAHRGMWYHTELVYVPLTQQANFEAKCNADGVRAELIQWCGDEGFIYQLV